MQLSRLELGDRMEARLRGTDIQQPLIRAQLGYSWHGVGAFLANLEEGVIIDEGYRPRYHPWNVFMPGWVCIASIPRSVVCAHLLHSCLKGSSFEARVNSTMTTSSGAPSLHLDNTLGALFIGTCPFSRCAQRADVRYQ